MQNECSFISSGVIGANNYYNCTDVTTSPRYSDHWIATEYINNDTSANPEQWQAGFFIGYYDPGSGGNNSAGFQDIRVNYYPGQISVISRLPSYDSHVYTHTTQGNNHVVTLERNSCTYTITVDGSIISTLTPDCSSIYGGHHEDYPGFLLSDSNNIGFQGLLTRFTMVDINTPTPTPTLTPSVKIVTSPTSGTEIVGSPFTVSVQVTDTNGQAFNAAQANVTVSSNLTITGLNYPTASSCNFNYTKRPSLSDPSFAGAIFNSSSTGCKVYTLTLTPTSTGTGTVTLTNGAIKAYADSSEILTGVHNVSFTINPAPTPTGTATQSLDDSITGTATNQWNYVGNWGHCTSCNETSPAVTFYNASQSYNNTTNDYVTIKFSGVQFKLYGVTDPRDGTGAVSIDNGPETNVDFYSSSRTGNVLLWTSPILANSTHTLKLRVTGNHNPNATDNYLILDRGDILANGTLSNLSVNTYLTDTYNSTLTITGTNDPSITHVFVNGSETGVTYPTSTTWQAVLSLPTYGNNTFVIYGKDNSNNQTASTSITVNKHTLGAINGDGVVDLVDASLFAVDFGKTSNLTYPLSNMNGDGNADLTDLSILAKLIAQ